jgi:hypothetical protein
MSRTFHSLFKVLFIFLSHYLFAIGLGEIFSLRRSTPADLDSILKLPDSWGAEYVRRPRRRERDDSPHWLLVPERFSRLVRLTLHPCTTIPVLPIPSTPDSSIGFSLFTRSYSGNHSCFLVLRSMICLSSAGVLACLRCVVMLSIYYAGVLRRVPMSITARVTTASVSSVQRSLHERHRKRFSPTSRVNHIMMCES